MKYILLFLLISVLNIEDLQAQSAKSNEKQQLCESENCVKYYKIWKKIFMKENGITEEYFEKHIQLIKKEIHTWNDGESFRVCYDIIIDWMKCKRCDQFIIKIDASNKLWDLKVKRGDYLNEEEINKALAIGVFSSGITAVMPIEHLKYPTSEAALQTIQDTTRNKTMKFRDFRFENKKRSFAPNGHPYFISYGEIDRKANKCQYGSLDLVTGDIEVRETLCVKY